MTSPSKTSALSALATPLGAVRTWLACAELDTAAMLPTSSVTDATGATRLRFLAREATIDLVVGEIRPELPTHLAVSGCRAALWRVTLQGRLSTLRFHAEWSTPPSEADGTPDSGEGLDAFTWRVADSVLSLGTEDGEILAARAQRHAGVPARLSGELTYSTVKYTDSGLIVPIAELRPQEVLEIHFIVAWSDAYSEERPSTWFAVDQGHGYVVQSLEGRNALPG
jgi:hypothetical protein